MRDNGLARATLRYQTKQARVETIHALSEQHPSYVYRRITVMRHAEGCPAGKCREQRLRVPLTKDGATLRSCNKSDAQQRGWTWDFIADSTVRGGALQMRSVLD
jgi:hypothetical protein